MMVLGTGAFGMCLGSTFLNRISALIKDVSPKDLPGNFPHVNIEELSSPKHSGILILNFQPPEL